MRPSVHRIAHHNIVAHRSPTTPSRRPSCYDVMIVALFPAVTWCRCAVLLVVVSTRHSAGGGDGGEATFPGHGTAPDSTEGGRMTGGFKHYRQNVLIMPRRKEGIKRYRDPSVCLSVPWRSCPRRPAALGYRHAGCLQLSHVRTADPPADGRTCRFAASRTAIGGGISSRRRRGDTLLF